MRTYHRGPDAVVTEEALTVGRRLGRSFALRDLDPDQLTITKTSSGNIAIFIVLLVLVTSVLGCMSVTHLVLYGNWWVGLGGVALAIVIFAAAQVPLYYKDDDIYVLMGVHRGVRTQLYSSSSEARTFQIWYAVREALENGPATALDDQQP